MPSAVNRIGRQYGRLTVIDKVKDSPYPELGIWLCRCECGSTLEKTGKRLYGAKSCGCAFTEARKIGGTKIRKPRQVTINQQYRSHKQSAGKRGLIPISRIEWSKIVFERCHYCGDIDKRQHSGHLHTQLECDILDRIVEINGIDRVDSSGGYTKENCVPCCERCNRMKMANPSRVFMAQVEKIINHMNLTCQT